MFFFVICYCELCFEWFEVKKLSEFFVGFILLICDICRIGNGMMWVCECKEFVCFMCVCVL